MEHLISPEWFTPLHSGWLVLIGAIAMAVLIKGADWLVEGATGFALRAGMSKVVVGATIVSLGTTSPEAAVSVLAAWGGDAGLALGNAVGSVIADTALIFGLGCMMAVLPVDRFLLNRQGWVQFGVAAILAAYCYFAWAVSDDPRITRGIGVILLAMLVTYIAISVRWGKQHGAMQGQAGEMDEVIEEAAHDPWWKLIVFFTIGLVLVLLTSHILIICVSELAVRWGVPQVVIASTIVAIGTSLPELVVGITAVRKGHGGLLIGNVIGADILNILFVTGAAAVAKPLPIIDPTATRPEIFLLLHLPAMMAVLLLFRFYIFAAIRKGAFSRWMGVPLVAMYVGYLIANAVLSR